MEVFVRAGIGTLLSLWNGKSWALDNTGVSSQKVTSTASEALCDTLTETFVAVSMTSLSDDHNILDSPALYVRVWLAC